LSNPSLEDFENQRGAIRHLSRLANDLERKLVAIPERNTLPDDVYRYPTVEDLVQQNFAIEAKPYPELTARGKEILDMAKELQNRAFFIMKENKQVTPDMITGTWQTMKTVYNG
jgi:hypothetical protein